MYQILQIRTKEIVRLGWCADSFNTSATLGRRTDVAGDIDNIQSASVVIGERVENEPQGMVFADKSWLEKPRGSREFYDGVQKFVAHCTPLVNSAGKIRCPCKRCRNILFKPIEWIGDHITDNGWDPLYTVWDKHGEPALPTPPLQATPTPPPLMSDMTALLDDLSYIPPNNEHNEPTQGDIGETSNEPTQATRNEFEELYSSANEALYPGCDHVTRLDFMAKFTYFKVKGKLTDSIFNEMLEWLQYALPESKGYKFPPSYYAIKKTFKTIGLGYESIHACEHDCCLFRGEVNKDLQFCPVCNTSRWKDSDTPGKKVPRKVLRYFPIIPRLQRLYKSRHTAKDMIWHATGKCTEPGKMQHPVDGGAWKKFDMKYPDFAKEPRNVRLGLCADGFNPFGNLSQTYSMWPVILTTYNLPPWLCMKESNFMLTLLIPGPKSPGKDIDVYLRPLIEDLQVLWDKKGVETTDIVSGQNFNMRAMVLWTINDFPARSSLSGWSGQGYKACPTCNEETPSIGVKNKIAYVGHRRFLRKPHKWRSSREFNGDTDHRDPPKEYPRDVILAQHARLLTRMADVARAHGGDGGGEDPSRPPPTSFGCAGCFINRGKGKRKPNLGGVKAGRKTRERTRNQVLKDAVAANKGRPIEIGFEDRADNTVVPTGPYSTQWGNYFGEMIRSIPLYYPSWQKVPAGDKARLMATLGSTYNLEPHMRSERWPRIEGYIQAQFGKSYNTNKATLKREHWIRDPETGAYDLDRIRRGKPDEYTDDEWEKYINFWNDPANAQRAETNRLNRSKSTVVSRHGSRSIPLTRHLMKITSATQEEPSEIDTFYRLHTVNGVFQDPEALRMYDRMRELEATGEHTTAEINAMVRGGKLRGHIPGVGPVMPGYVRSRLSYTAPVDRSRDVDFMMSLMRSDNRFADAFARYDSGGASGSGGSRARDSLPHELADSDV
ncbi:hypothetical protein Tco_0031378 [Tanacetum coccineum]